jgi:RimJ/RimL family protein N-acetyltransferase
MALPGPPVVASVPSMGPPLLVARLMRRAGWTALQGAENVGTASALMRPDGRWFISIDTWDAEVFSALLDAIKSDLRQPLYVNLDAASDDERERWHAAGFKVARREYEYELAVESALTQLRDCAVPNGFVLVPADEVDEGELRRLDDALRQLIPGSDGWYNDPQEFRNYTFDERHFNAAVYLVAIDEPAERCAGLVRVWMDTGHPRLGMIGVLPSHQRRGLARAMLSTVFARLHQLGVQGVAAEADADNIASNALLSGIGGRQVGVTLELLFDPAQL